MKTSFYPTSGWVRVLGCLFLYLIFSSEISIAKQNTNFISLKLPRNIQIQIPKEWWLLGPNHERMIQTSVEAVLDISGLEINENQKISLIKANSMPRSTYAAVGISSSIPPSIMPSEFESISAADRRDIKIIMKDNLEKLLSAQGLKLVQFIDARIEKFLGYPSIITEYRRSGTKGSVFVQVIEVFTNSQELSINLSYRESEIAIWKPVIGKIRSSIVIGRWP